MVESVGQVRVEITATARALVNELNKSETEVKKTARRITREVDGIDERFAKLSKGIRSGLLNTLGIGSVAAATAGLVALGRNALSAADDLNTAAVNAGIGAERFQRLRFAAEQSDLTAREFEEGFRRLNRRRLMFFLALVSVIYIVTYVVYNLYFYY